MTVGGWYAITFRAARCAYGATARRIYHEHRAEGGLSLAQAVRGFSVGRGDCPVSIDPPMGPG